MGIIKMLVYDGVKSAVKSAKQRSFHASQSQMKGLGKTTVTKGDVEELGQQIEQVRNDMHAGLRDIFKQTGSFNQEAINKLSDLAESVNRNTEALQETIKMFAKIHGF